MMVTDTTDTGEGRLVYRAERRIGRHSGGEGLCIRCAVGNDKFRERAPYLGEGSEARAWIDGRSFTLFLYRPAKSVCTACGEMVSAIYSPEDQQAA